MKHQLLYVVPSVSRLKSPNTHRIDLPDLDLTVRFETPGSLKDLSRLQGLLLCEITGERWLDLETHNAARTRLRLPLCWGCPASTVNMSPYVWK